MYETLIIIVGLMLLGWLSTLWRLCTNADLPHQWNLDVTIDEEAEQIDYPPLCVMIPARNEASNIETAVRSVLAIDWPAPLKVIVVDDRSTDDTPKILARLAAKDERLTVHLGQDPTPGWLGKPHALHQAQRKAAGELYLFVDADVTVNREGVLKTWKRMQSEGVTMSSVLGRLKTESFFEHIIQPRLGAILAGGNPLHEVNDPEHERVLANGQFLLFTRSAYEELGGHESIRDSVLDDVDFAKRAKQMGVPFRLYYGQSVFSCRMYRGLSEIWAGWSKNLFPGINYSLIGTLILTSLMFVWTCMPFIAAFILALTDSAWSYPWLLPMLVALTMLILITDLVGHRIRGYRWTYFWTFPLGMLMICLLFWNSAFKIRFGKGATWKGRRVESSQQRNDRHQRMNTDNKS